MGDMLQDGLAWLDAQRASHMASPVEYRRDPDAFAVNATFGKTDYEVADESGLTIGSHVWDFLITADELSPEGFEPEPGDVIAAPSAGSGQAGRKYEVMNLGGEGCWRWSDPYRQTYRIHTKDIGPDTPVPA